MKLKLLFLFLTLVCNIYADSSSEESSEERSNEADKEEEADTAVLDDCENRCVQQQLRNENVYTKVLVAACREGCEAQDDIFDVFKMEYPNTVPSRLLGAAVDKCWDSCLSHDLARAQFCISGCSAMKEIQGAKEELKEKNKKEDKPEFVIESPENDESEQKQEESDEEEIEEDNKIDGNTFERNSILDNEDFKPKQEDTEEKETINQVQEKANEQMMVPVWRIRVFDTDDSYLNMDNFLRQMLFMSMNDLASHSGGHSEENSQLSWPTWSETPAAAQTSEEGNSPSVLDQVSSSFEELKDSFSRAYETPDFQENIFFALLGLSGLLILSSLLNSTLCPKKTQQEEDQYYLPPGAALPVKLPTYEECIVHEYKKNFAPEATEEAKEAENGEEAEKKPLDI